ncbi:Uncharacterised protein [Mycobacteroides abscessus subsp. massiliense]|nr:Uncharacterised protein [Mycobacteroides abscessus subsp. massiliense]
MAVEGHGAVGVADLDPGAVAGGRARRDDDAVGGGHDRGADAVGDVDAAVQRAPPVAEAGGEGAVGGHHEPGSQ